MADCGVTGNCLEGFVVAVAAFVVWAASSSLVLFTPTTSVRAAMAALRTERDRLGAECEAFERFGARIAALTPTRPGPVGTLTAATAGSPPAVDVDGRDGRDGRGGAEEGTATVRTAYRETVMAVDHYDDDYGEPLGEHLANELGNDIAAAVAAGGPVSPELQQALLSGTKRACASRRELRGTLADEADRLDGAATRLVDIADDVDESAVAKPRRRTFGDLEARWRGLRRCRERLDELLADQQAAVRDTITVGFDRVDAADLHAFLYGDLDARYPVLADCAALGERINDVDHRLTRAIAGRP
ncbi:MAG: hypothetical protein ABEJ79_00270 [Halolamina sp.]